MTTKRWIVPVVVVSPSLLSCRYFSFSAVAAYHESKTVWSIALTNRGCI
jgi:hypothetical protein